MVEVFVNNGDPDRTPRSSASDLGLNCLPVTRLGVSSLQWVNGIYFDVYKDILFKDHNFLYPKYLDRQV